MELKAFLKKHQNLIGTAAVLLAVIIFTAVRYDYYYDLNDDVLMKDILAGVYTGTPEGHNIQMLWLISALISCFYKAVRGLPWYGLFLCLCHYGSLGLILYRSLTFCSGWKKKSLLLVTEGLLITGLFLDHLVSAQYTVTCTLLASAAAFLFMTTDRELPAKEFIKKNAGTVLLVFIAYLIRSEMLLLLLPMICAAGVIRWGSEETIFTKDNFRKYLTVIGAVLFAILVGQVSHRIAYGSKEWRAFTEYFNNRTELYDFQELPEYEENKDFYESIGLAESERELLDNYNFGLDEKIDEKLLGKVAVYAAKTRKEKKAFSLRLYESLSAYYRRTVYGPSHNESDYPWNYVILLSYLMVFAAAMQLQEKGIFQRFFGILWQLAFLFAVRTVLWLWLLMRGRVPVRISHSMYLMELCILAGMLFVKIKNSKKAIRLIVSAGYLLIGVLILPFSVDLTDRDVAAKAENNIKYDKLYACLADAEHKDNFYFIDVYSSVGYTEKMFVNVDNALDNYDIMGGWAVKSPLWKKKLAAFSVINMEKALTDREDVYYLQETGADTGWLIHYYADRGKTVILEQVENIDGYFEVYKIKEQ